MDRCLAQPRRGCVFSRTPIRRNPVGVGDALDFGSQGSAAHNPGLNAVAPLGLSEWPERLATASELDSDPLVTEVKRIRGKKLPLTAAGVQDLRDEYTRTIEPARARARAAETLKLGTHS